MKMLRRGIRPIMRVDDYRGTCYHCQGVLEIPTPFLVMPLYRTEEGHLIVTPTEVMECPHCHIQHTVIRITGEHVGTTSLTPPDNKGLN